MWREPAIRSLLLEDICHLPRGDSGPGEHDSAREAGQRLDKARRRAGVIAVVSWIALLVLFALRSSGRTWLPTEAGEETIFTLGVLAVAVYSGFRLGQLEKLTAVSRVLDELRERSENS